ncbi:hypothetical protein [Serratia bockelmannii]|uniref:hypothetical protein n=1 Tax=Serratia bockelmannii TaxID=2703793 RepID=UPI003FA6A321
MAADPKSVSVGALKSAFKEGATPNEEDYHALIDLAAVGGKALGGNDNIPPTLSPGMGLQMAAGKLAVKVKKDAGVTLDGDGVAVKGDGKTVTVTAAGVGIKVKTNGGLESNTTDGLHVKTGLGLRTDKGALEIKLAEKGGLKADNDGLAVQVAPDKGLEIDAKTGLKVKLKAGKDNYIESTDAGLAITPQGIDAIKTALKSVSLDALDAAVKGTSQGYKLDSNNPAAGDVEAKIAEKLNEAFTEGWHLTQPRDALFNALKAFRESNKDKIYKEGLIAPSAMTGKPGLYNQEGIEYGTGTVIAYKVSPAGVAQAVASGADYKADGIYALVGKLDATGTPKAGDAYEKVTPHALMVLVAQGGVTVVGHWDFGQDDEWTSANKGKGWSPAATRDALTVAAEREWVLSEDKKKWETAIAEQKRTKDNEIGELQKKLTEADTLVKTLKEDIKTANSNHEWAIRKAVKETEARVVGATVQPQPGTFGAIKLAVRAGEYEGKAIAVMKGSPRGEYGAIKIEKTEGGKYYIRFNPQCLFFGVEGASLTGAMPEYNNEGKWKVAVYKDSRQNLVIVEVRSVVGRVWPGGEVTLHFDWTDPFNIGGSYFCTFMEQQKPIWINIWPAGVKTWLKLEI